METERNLVARHYEQTYDQVNTQIDSARQLVEIRKKSQESPERPYPRRPKNRVIHYLNDFPCIKHGCYRWKSLRDHFEIKINQIKTFVDYLHFILPIFDNLAN